jgi:parallel beta-helix repeat protein
VLTGNSASSRGGGACFGTLNNCTLTGNTAGSGSGGGAYLCALSNCILRGNSATFGGGAYYGTLNSCTLTNNSATSGAGAYSATLNNCALTGNSASAYAPYGGGGYYCTFNNCTISGNYATGTWPYGGGAYDSTAYNSILYFNTASNGANYSLSGQSPLNYCCTTPDPGGVGNITSTPLFVNSAAGNLRLQNNSPCINSGNNSGISGSADLDGNARVVSGTVDMGAYEFQGAGSLISYAWLQQYGLPTDGSADFADPDHDGMNNYQEWLAGTNPTNALSVFKITSATTTRTFGPAGGVAVSWVSQNTRLYYLQRSAALAQPGFSTIQDNIVGQAGTTTYTDTNALGPGPFFYRVGVKSP